MNKIIILDNSIYVTGALKSIVAVANALKDCFDFEFAMDARGTAARYVADAGFVIHDFRYLEISKSWRLIFYPFALIANAFRLANLSRQLGVRLLHVNDFYNQAGNLAMLINRQLKTVYHVRLLSSSYIAPIYPILAKLTLRWASAIVCVSRAAGLPFMSAKNMHIIYDALTPTQKYPSKQCPEILPKCRFIYIGNYVRGKGQNFALDAFKKIAQKLPKSTLEFIGSGVDGELDKAFVNELRLNAALDGLKGRIQFKGPVSDIEKAMKEADVVVNFSESESFSMVCLEALTFGLPLVVSDCGGPSEMVQHEINGMLVPNRDSDQAAIAMFRLATEPGLAKKLADAAYSSAPVFSSLDDSALKLTKVYEALLEH